MKKIFMALAFLAIGAHAQKVVGQGNVQRALVTWDTGDDTGKTRLLFLGGSVFVDTSTTGQAGEWKRIDNTADSCSNAFLMASDELGMTRAIWENRLWQTVRSVDPDSGGVVYRVQTREKLYNGATKQTQWTPWTYKGANNGYLDVSIQDSILTLAPRVTTKISQYSLFGVTGSQAKICPDNDATTATGAADSVFTDSLHIFTR